MPKGVRSQGTFKVLVAHPKWGGDPTVPGPLGKPPVARRTFAFAPVAYQSDAGAQTSANARLTLGPTGLTPSHGEITVADNDFTTGRAEVRLGNYYLLSNLDFIPGVNANATAVALAAAISLLPGYVATANLNVVLVQFGNTADTPEFVVRFLGARTNFTLSPDNGHLHVGNPAIGAPLVG